MENWGRDNCGLHREGTSSSDVGVQQRQCGLRKLVSLHRAYFSSRNRDILQPLEINGFLLVAFKISLLFKRNNYLLVQREI